MIAFVTAAAARSRDARLVIAGRSQERRDIPLLVFARPAAASDPDEVGKVIRVLGQPHEIEAYDANGSHCDGNEVGCRSLSVGVRNENDEPERQQDLDNHRAIFPTSISPITRMPSLILWPFASEYSVYRIETGTSM